MSKRSPYPCRWAGRCALVLLVGSLFVGQPASAGRRCTPCQLTARLAYTADLSAARGEYRIELGKALNLGEREDREEQAAEAREALVENLRYAREVLAARKALCDLLGEYRYDVEIDPAYFLTPAETASAPNQFLPLVPGTVYTYESETDEGTETIVVEVTSNTVEIAGVTCIEVRDTVSLDGDPVEDTFDWYAQDEEGSVWYFGEISFNFEDGEIIDLEGSWKAGRDGAKPGIVMPAEDQLEVGKAYRQEWLLGEAEDAGVVVGLDETITSHGVVYTGCVKTQDLNPHDPGLVEFKYYAPGIGFVYEIKPEDGETVELISVAP